MFNIVPGNTPQNNPSSTKQCTKCHLWLQFDNFNVTKTKSGYRMQSWCKKCVNKNTKASPEQQRNADLKYTYGITAKQYDRMLEEQGYVCKICGLPETSIDHQTKQLRRLAVDHDHKTDDVRGLLCWSCNVSLGKMKEDPGLIQKLKEYAEWCQTREPNVKIVQLKLVE